MVHVTLDAIKNLHSKISSIRFGMLTTINEDGSLSSRPMTEQTLDDNGDLWFFISNNSQLADDINRNGNSSVTFSNPSESIYVAITGNAEILNYQEKAAELWNPTVAAWFPQGLEDPQLALLKLSISNAEYWDSNTNKMIQLFAEVAAVVSGEPLVDMGQHEKLNFQ